MDTRLYILEVTLAVLPNYLLLFLLPLRWMKRSRTNGKMNFILIQTVTAVVRSILLAVGLIRNWWWLPVVVLSLTVFSQVLDYAFAFRSLNDFIDAYILFGLVNSMIFTPVTSVLASKITYDKAVANDLLGWSLRLLTVLVVSIMIDLISMYIMDILLFRFERLSTRKKSVIRKAAFISFAVIFIISMISVMLNGGNPVVNSGIIMKLTIPVWILFAVVMFVVK